MLLALRPAQRELAFTNHINWGFMAVYADEPVGQASVQYNDFMGSAAADGHGGPVLHELAKIVGLDLERYMIAGLEFGHWQLGGRDGLVIFAVEKASLGGLTVDQYAAQHGEVPVVDFKVHDLAALEVLERGLKRLEVQLVLADLDGVPLRRVARDDLNYAGN